MAQPVILAWTDGNGLPACGPEKGLESHWDRGVICAVCAWKPKDSEPTVRGCDCLHVHTGVLAKVALQEGNRLTKSFNLYWEKPSFVLSGECVISLVLSHCSKNLKRRASVTVQFYSASKGKYTFEVWGWADPKGEASIYLGFLLL